MIKDILIGLPLGLLVALMRGVADLLELAAHWIEYACNRWII